MKKTCDQTCSFELSEKLKELGVVQDSYFVWFRLSDKDNYDIAEQWQIDDERFNVISAFTVGELLDLLPAFIDTKINEPFNGFWLAMNKRRSRNIQYILNYHCDTAHFGERPNDLIAHNIYDENCANALAKMLIYILENKLS